MTGWLTVFGIVCLLLLLHIFIPWGVKLALRKRFLRHAQQSEAIFLTFDDGPNTHATETLLDLLKEYQVKASFFILGRNAEKIPQLLRRMKNEGHCIGDHSYSHTHAWKTDPISTAVDLLHGATTLSSILNTRPRFFRPPFGKLNIASLLYIWMRRNVVAFWTIDPRDYDQTSDVVVAAHVIERLKPGSVVLLHDGSPESDRTATSTVDAVRRILEAGKASGFTFASLETLFPIKSNG